MWHAINTWQPSDCLLWTLRRLISYVQWFFLLFPCLAFCLVPWRRLNQLHFSILVHLDLAYCILLTNCVTALRLDELISSLRGTKVVFKCKKTDPSGMCFCPLSNHILLIYNEYSCSTASVLICSTLEVVGVGAITKCKLLWSRELCTVDVCCKGERRRAGKTEEYWWSCKEDWTTVEAVAIGMWTLNCRWTSSLFRFWLLNFCLITHNFSSE